MNWYKFSQVTSEKEKGANQPANSAATQAGTAPAAVAPAEKAGNATAQNPQSQAKLNEVRNQKNMVMGQLKQYVSQKNPAIGAGITNSGLANKIILQTDTALAADANVQKIVDQQVQLDKQFMSLLPPQELAGTKAAIQRQIAQTSAYADQIAKGQAPAQRQAALERKIFWMNMAGQTLAGIGGVIAAGGTPAGFVAGATAWDAASAKAQGQQYGLKDLGKSVALNTVTTLGGIGGGKLLGMGANALSGGLGGGAVRTLGQFIGKSPHIVHAFEQILQRSGSSGLATVPHYLAMEIGPEKLTETLVHAGLHMLDTEKGAVDLRTPYGAQEVQTQMAQGKNISAKTGTART